MARVWTEEEDKFVRANWGILTAADIAEKLGLKYPIQAAARANKLGLIKKKKKPKKADMPPPDTADEGPEMNNELVCLANAYEALKPLLPDGSGRALTWLASRLGVKIEVKA